MQSESQSKMELKGKKKMRGCRIDELRNTANLTKIEILIASKLGGRRDI